MICFFHMKSKELSLLICSLLTELLPFSNTLRKEKVSGVFVIGFKAVIGWFTALLLSCLGNGCYHSKAARFPEVGSFWPLVELLQGADKVGHGGAAAVSGIIQRKMVNLKLQDEEYEAPQSRAERNKELR